MGIEINQEQISERIEKLRIMHGDTKVVLAKAANVTSSYISRLLYGKASWKQDMVKNIASHYNVTFEYLYFGFNGVEYGVCEITDFNSQVIEMLEYMNTLTPDEQRTAGKTLLKGLYRMIDAW